jgi:hypothetical protein
MEQQYIFSCVDENDETELYSSTNINLELRNTFLPSINNSQKQNKDFPRKMSRDEEISYISNKLDLKLNEEILRSMRKNRDERYKQTELISARALLQLETENSGIVNKTRSDPDRSASLNYGYFLKLLKDVLVKQKNTTGNIVVLPKCTLR